MDDLDKIIGATGSLSDAIINAKSAVSYPPYGIPCLIHGPNGVGKTSFSYSMIRYAQKTRNNPKPAGYDSVLPKLSRRSLFISSIIKRD